MKVEDIEKICYEMKLKALEMANKTTFGAHIGGGFSAMEILASLYSVANIPSMDDEGRDRIIISKWSLRSGILYCFMEDGVRQRSRS